MNLFVEAVLAWVVSYVVYPAIKRRVSSYKPDDILWSHAIFTVAMIAWLGRYYHFAC